MVQVPIRSAALGLANLGLAVPDEPSSQRMEYYRPPHRASMSSESIASRYVLLQ